jgi:hypothetical protein
MKCFIPALNKEWSLNAEGNSGETRIQNVHRMNITSKLCYHVKETGMMLVINCKI